MAEVPELRGDRVVLSAHADNEAAAHAAGEDEETARRLGWWPDFSTEETVRVAYANWASNWQDDGPVRAFAARDPVSGALVPLAEARLMDRHGHEPVIGHEVEQVSQRQELIQPSGQRFNGLRRRWVKRQIEQAVVSAAGDIAAFCTARVPVPCTAWTRQDIPVCHDRAAGVARAAARGWAGRCVKGARQARRRVLLAVARYP